MRTFLFRLAAAATAAGLLAGGAGCGPVLAGRAAEPVVIGADLALTGSGSALGTVHHRALLLRIRQLNQQGLAGDRRLELRVRDNRSEPQVAATNLAELAADPAVTAIVTDACGQCMVAAAGRLAEHRVPAIALAAGDQVARPVAQRRYVFQLAPDAGEDADLIAAELVRDRAATVGLVTTADGYGEAGLRELTAAAARGGFALVVHRRVVAGDPAGLAGAAASVAGWRPATGFVPDPQPPPGPDAVVVWLPAPAAGQLAAELRRAGYRGRLHLDAIGAGEVELPTQALAGASLVFTDTPVADQLIAATPARAARQTWFRDYLARHGSYHAQASWAADAIAVIADAVRRAGLAGRPPDREVLRDQIESTRRLDGLTGLIRYSADQHSGLHPQSLTLLVARDGRWHPAG